MNNVEKKKVPTSIYLGMNECMNENKQSEKYRLDKKKMDENNLRKLHCMEQTTLFSFFLLYNLTRASM